MWTEMKHRHSLKAQVSVLVRIPYLPLRRRPDYTKNMDINEGKKGKSAGKLKLVRDLEKESKRTT